MVAEAPTTELQKTQSQRQVSMHIVAEKIRSVISGSSGSAESAQQFRRKASTTHSSCTV